MRGLVSPAVLLLRLAARKLLLANWHVDDAPMNFPVSVYTYIQGTILFVVFVSVAANSMKWLRPEILTQETISLK